jgi:hypothetical protein
MAFQPVPNGSGAFQFKHVASGLCLSINGGTGGTVTTATCSTAATQAITLSDRRPENLALRATVSAPSTFSSYSVTRINDGDRSTALGGSSSWVNAHTSTPNGLLPQAVELDFGSRQTFDRINLYTTSGYELQDYDLEFWDGAAWRRIAPITGNRQAYRTHGFPVISASKVRIVCRRGPPNQTIYARVNELEIYRSE